MPTYEELAAAPEPPAWYPAALALEKFKALAQQRPSEGADRDAFDFEHRDELISLAGAAGIDVDVPMGVPRNQPRAKLEALKAEYEAEVAQYRGTVGSDEEEAREAELDRRIAAINVALGG